MGKSRGGGSGGRSESAVGPDVVAWERTIVSIDPPGEIGRLSGEMGDVIVEKVGDETQIMWLSSELMRAKGGVLTHFHPGETGTAAALSDDDVAVALTFGLTVRAFGHDGSWAEVTARTPVRHDQVVWFRTTWAREYKKALAGHTEWAQGSGLIRPDGTRNPTFSVAESYRDWNDRLADATRTSLDALGITGVTYRRGGGRR